MKILDNYKYFGGMSLAYGFIFTFCLYKNISGVTFPLCVGTTILFAILFMKKINYRLMKHSVPYLAGMGLPYHEAFGPLYCRNDAAWDIVCLYYVVFHAFF